MSNNVLPNLSEWFEVPRGATIPPNTRYVALWSDDSITVASDGGPYYVAKEGRYFTEKPIEAVRETLEDVIREGIGGCYTPAQIARAVESFYAEQPKQPLVIIDNDGPGEEWRLNSDGTYDWWRAHQAEFATPYKGYTREEISKEFGIKEERD